MLAKALRVWAFAHFAQTASENTKSARLSELLFAPSATRAAIRAQSDE
jgi:hypothetical protein